VGDVKGERGDKKEGCETNQASKKSREKPSGAKATDKESNREIIP